MSESKIEWNEGPPEQEIDSPFGKLWVKAVGWGVMVDANHNDREIVINGVRYSFILRLQYGANDRLELELQKGDPYGYHAIYLVRKDWVQKGLSYNQSGGSSAARDKVKAQIIPLVQKWLDANPAIAAAGRFAAANNDYLRADEEYQKARLALDEANKVLGAAWAKRADAHNELIQIQQAGAWRQKA